MRASAPPSPNLCRTLSLSIARTATRRAEGPSDILCGGAGVRSRGAARSRPSWDVWVHRLAVRARSKRLWPPRRGQDEATPLIFPPPGEGPAGETIALAGGTQRLGE